jgi:heme/copper-type cytochrome/quinol oxidase subunit 2
MQTDSPTITLKQIILAKTQYLYILIGLFLTSGVYILLAILNIFIWWFWFGEGENSDERYHPKTAQLLTILPLVVIYIIYCLLIFRSLKSHNLPRVKSFLILMLLMIVFHLMRYVLLSAVIYS